VYQQFSVCTIDPVFKVSSARYEQATSRKPANNTPFEIEKGAVSTVFEMSPARTSQTTPQKPATPEKPKIVARVQMTPNDAQ